MFIDNAPTIKVMLSKEADGIMKHFFEIIEFKTQEHKNGDGKKLIKNNSNQSTKFHYEFDFPTWYQKTLQHALKNALIASLVENAAADLEIPNKLKKRPPSFDQVIKIDRACAEWGISTATYQLEEWMHLFKHVDNENHLSGQDLPRSTLFFFLMIINQILCGFFCALLDVFFNQKLKNHLSYLLDQKGSIIYITPVSYKIPQKNRSARGFEEKLFKSTLISAARWISEHFPFLFTLASWPTPSEIEEAHNKGKLSRFNPSSNVQPCAGDILFINDVLMIEDSQKLQLLKLLEFLGMKPNQYMHARNDVDAGRFFHRASMWKKNHKPSKKITVEPVCQFFFPKSLFVFCLVM